MNFILQDPGGRYQRRAAAARRRFFLLAAAIGLCCFVSYRLGAAGTQSGEAAYKEQAGKLQGEKDTLEQKLTSLRSDVQSAQVRYQQLQAQYKQDVPSGTLKQLTDAVRQQLDDGIKPERLLYVIQSVHPPRGCTDPVTKRFVMRTPVYKGPHGSVSFGQGAVTVTGEGAPSVNQSGREDAWYDPGKPVSITFTGADGKKAERHGLLPIEYSVVVGKKEYRFTVAAGERSFIRVTSDSCDAP
ncbi:MAG: hypothetical protein KGQ70_07730 [Alphaproteobacteria bacterium]|nr:hypothetical protein [Alphaproteobacteria bacterium]